MHRARIITLAIAVASFATARGDDPLDQFERLRLSQQTGSDQGIEAAPPRFDVQGVINESNAFLREREPEMTAEEYALYERISGMLESNSTFALRMLESMMREKKEPSPAFEFILGNVYYAAGSADKAETHYRNAINRFPTFLRAWNNLGILFYTANRYADAAPCFSRSIVLGDREPITFGLLGYCLEQNGDIVSAEMAYMQALAGDPGNAAWKEGLLRICIKGQQFSRAESLVRILIREQPKDVRFWASYANILVSRQEKLKAIAVLEIVVMADLAGAPELTLLGDLYAEQGMALEAIATYRRLADGETTLGTDKLLHLAHVLVSADRFDDARSTLAALPATTSPQHHLKGLQVRAELHVAAKDWPEARRTLDELLAIAPLDGRALILLGQTHLATDDSARATLAFEAALQDPGHSYRARLELANVALKARQFAQSAQHLREALRLQDTPAVQDYLARVQRLIVEQGESGP